MSEKKNNASTLTEYDSDIKVAVNSIQRTLYVKRLHVDTPHSRNRRYYYTPYDIDNLYPNKAKEIAKRSGTTSSAIKTFAKFISGEGFENKEIAVNRDGSTIWDMLRFVAWQYATFNGFCLHFNYNVFGQITEIQYVNFEFVRWNDDLTKLIVNPEWEYRGYRNFEKKYMPYNPANVMQEIAACGGIDNYNGQLLYWINSNDIYTTCYFDEVLDDAQFEAECKLYSLSSIQNDYSLSGIISYPKNIEANKEKENVQEELRGDKGSANAGGIRVVSAMAMEGMNNWKWFTPISRNNIDDLHTNQVERAKFNIYAAYNQPPILNGVATEGMFNEASFIDAFNYYNATTETERKDIERIINQIIQVSIWSNIGNIEIVPKRYEAQGITSTSSDGTKTQTQSPELLKQQSQAQLKGSVGGVQAILEIQQSVSEGTTDLNAAVEILKEIYGISEDQAIKMIGVPSLDPGVDDSENPNAEVNENVKNLTGRQLQGIFRITKRFKKEDLTKDQAANLLKSGYGFSDEEVEIWLTNDE